MTYDQASALIDQFGWRLEGDRHHLAVAAMLKRRVCVEPWREGWRVWFPFDNTWAGPDHNQRPEYWFAFDSREDAKVCAVTIQMMRTIA
jgi:hypothetical protein